MSNDAHETRTLMSPRTGTKVSILIGLVLLTLAAYWYWTPLSFPATNGQIFGCGSAASPPTDAFPKNVCRTLPEEFQKRALFTAIAGLLVALLGSALFGFERRTESRVSRRELHDDDVDEDSYDEPTGGARRAGDDFPVSRSRRRRYEEEDGRIR